MNKKFTVYFKLGHRTLYLASMHQPGFTYKKNQRGIFNKLDIYIKLESLIQEHIKIFGHLYVFEKV